MNLEERIKKQQEKAQKAQEKAHKEQEQLMKLQLESFEKMRPILSKNNIKTADDLEKHFADFDDKSKALEAMFEHMKKFDWEFKTAGELADFIDSFTYHKKSTNSSAQ